MGKIKIEEGSYKFVRDGEEIVFGDLEYGEHWELLNYLQGKRLSFGEVISLLDERGSEFDMGVIERRGSIISITGISGRLIHPAGRGDIKEIRDKTGEIIRRDNPGVKVLMGYPF